MNQLLRQALFTVWQANPEEQNSGTHEPAELHDPNAPSPETLEKIPTTPTSAGGIDWGTMGRARAQALLAAEQGVETANQTVQETKLRGLLECLEIGLDEQARATYIVGIRSELELRDGGDISKTHNNYVGMLKRVSKHVGADSTRLGWAFETLKTSGKLEDKIAKFEATGQGGGGNKGSGKKAEVAAMKAAADELRAQGITVTPETLATAVKSLGQPKQTPEEKPQKPAPKPSTKPEPVTARQIQQQIEFCHEADIEGIARALSKRCQMSQQYAGLGKAIAAFFDTLKTDVPGSVLTESEAQQLAVTAHQ